MRLGGPIFRKVATFEEEVALHKQLGFGAAFCKFIQDPVKRQEYKQAYAEADSIVLEPSEKIIHVCVGGMLPIKGSRPI